MLVSAEGDKESSARRLDVWELAAVVVRILHADRLVLVATGWCMVQLFFCRQVSNREGQEPGAAGKTRAGRASLLLQPVVFLQDFAQLVVRQRDHCVIVDPRHGLGRD